MDMHIKTNYTNTLIFVFSVLEGQEGRGLVNVIDFVGKLSFDALNCDH